MLRVGFVYREEEVRRLSGFIHGNSYLFFLFSIDDIIIICLGSSDGFGAEWGEEGEDLLPQG